MNLPRVIRLTGCAAANIPLICLWTMPRAAVLLPIVALVVFVALAVLVLFMGFASVVESLELLSADARAKRATESVDAAPF